MYESQSQIEPKPLNILVVEDDETDAYLIHRALTFCPRAASITFAGDGIAALSALDRMGSSPDLALIDLHMPRMNGYRLVAELVAREGAKFPLVVLTSAKENNDVMRSVVKDATRVITKPVALTELTETLKPLIAAL